VSALFVGILGVLLAAAPGDSAPNAVVSTNDPAQQEYRKLLLDDDAAEQDVNHWSDNAEAFHNAGAGDPKTTLHLRIQQRLDGIKKEYEDFLQRHPDHVNALLAFGSFLDDRGDDEGALTQWQKALALAPKNPAALDNLANYYAHRGPVKKAFEYYDKAIAIDDHQSVYYQNLAVAVYLFRTDARDYYRLSDQGVFDKALELYRKAIKLDPDNFVLFTDYAETYYGLRPPRWQEALAAWTQALKIAHDEQEREGVYIHLARINLQLGQYVETRAALNAVTNSFYSTLKGRIARNLDEAMKKAPANNATGD
jgi:tetratricopeptide (TPR) repeat protein